VVGWVGTLPLQNGLRQLVMIEEILEDYEDLEREDILAMLENDHCQISVVVESI
jgi:uncharacterized protein (DUF433 family)